MRLAGHRSNGYGTLVIDRLFGAFGRLRIASGTSDPGTLWKMNRALTALYRAGDLQTLEEVRARRISPRQLLELEIPLREAPAEQAILAVHLYVFRSAASGNVKIGIAADVRRRLSVMRCHSWDEIELVTSRLSSREEEKAVHSLLASSRIRGEWYSPSPEVLSWIEEQIPRGERS